METNQVQSLKVVKKMEHNKLPPITNVLVVLAQALKVKDDCIKRDFAPHFYQEAKRYCKQNQIMFFEYFKEERKMYIIDDSLYFNFLSIISGEKIETYQDISNVIFELDKKLNYRHAKRRNIKKKIEVFKPTNQSREKNIEISRNSKRIKVHAFANSIIIKYKSNPPVMFDDESLAKLDLDINETIIATKSIEIFRTIHESSLAREYSYFLFLGNKPTWLTHKFLRQKRVIVINEDISELETAKMFRWSKLRYENLENEADITPSKQIFNEYMLIRYRDNPPILYDEVTIKNKIFSGRILLIENGETFVNINKTYPNHGFKYVVYATNTYASITKDFLLDKDVVRFFDYDIAGNMIYNRIVCKKKEFLKPPFIELYFANYSNKDLYRKQKIHFTNSNTDGYFAKDMLWLGALINKYKGGVEQEIISEKRKNKFLLNYGKYSNMVNEEQDATSQSS